MLFLLWTRYKEHLIEDFVKRHNSIEISESLALQDIEKTLNNLSPHRSLLDYNFPDTSELNTHLNYTSSDSITNEENEFVDNNYYASYHNNNYTKLNKDQLYVYNKITETILANTFDNNESKIYMLDGSAGTGKTFLYNTIISYMKKENKKFMSVAFTGIAATLLINGKTSHNSFNLKLNITNDTPIKLKPLSKVYKCVKQTEFIIWDEVTMVSSSLMNYVDRFCREVTENDTPFGGKVILLGGDFRQCLPRCTESSS